MADEVVTQAAPPAATPTPEASAPAVAPVESVSSSTTAASSEVKSETTAAPILETVLGSDDAPKIEEKPTEVKPVETKTEVKPEEKPVDSEKPVEIKQEEKPAELPVFEWKLPEGVTVEKERITEFNKELGEFAITSKVDAKTAQEFGQKLINRHISEVQSIAEKVAQAYSKVWQDQTKNWYDEFVKDPEIGGNRRDTTVNAAREFIRRHGGTEKQQTDLKSWLKTSGVGNHPGLIRIFANANLALAEPKPVKAETPVSQEKSSLKTKMYGRKKS